MKFKSIDISVKPMSFKLKFLIRQFSYPNFVVCRRNITIKKTTKNKTLNEKKYLQFHKDTTFSFNPTKIC